MITKTCIQCSVVIARPLYPSMADEVKFCDAICRRAYGQEQKKLRLVREIDRSGTKQCTRCGAHHPKDYFPANRRTPGGLGSWCNQCHSDYRIKRRRDFPEHTSRLTATKGLRNRNRISPERFAALLVEQGGGCAICGDVVGLPGRNVRLYVDHCHRTNVVRGLLCQRCNSGIGLLDDSADLLKIAAAYLERHEKISLQGAILKLAEEDR